MNKYLLGIMEAHLNIKEYDVLRMSYGLDCDKMSAKEIADKLKIDGTAAYVRISQIKRDAINKLIDSVDPAQVADLL
jgi:DNA-directed RNA polymerase specialized sigma subunit